MALYLKLMLHFNVQVLPLKPNATQHWLDLINDWDSLLCEARHVAVAIDVSPEFHSRTRILKWLMRHFKVMFLMSPWTTLLYTQLTTRLPTIGNICNDFKGILNFQDLSEEDLSASCNNLKSKYSNWICLKTWRNKCSIWIKIYNATFSVPLSPLQEAYLYGYVEWALLKHQNVSFHPLFEL